MADIVINPLSGKGDKKVSISSSVNEGIDKSEEYAISTLDGKHSKKITVNQVGKREVFMVKNEETGENEEFLLSNGDTFNVLKEEFSNE